jgi:hypothetical protein
MFSSRLYFNQGRPFALKICSGLFSFSYLNLFSAFVALISEKKRFYFCNRLFIDFTIIKTFYAFWILIFLITGNDLKCLFSLLLYFSWNECTDDDLYLNILHVCPASFKEMSCLVAKIESLFFRNRRHCL